MACASLRFSPVLPDFFTLRGRAGREAEAQGRAKLL
jgi:hypothetical protein